MFSPRQSSVAGTSTFETGDAAVESDERQPPTTAAASVTTAIVLYGVFIGFIES
jgi:hypothetical protein